MQKNKPQVQYLRPGSPPSMMKKSPLAMLVETCSSIGQELTRSSKSMESAFNADSRKRQSSSSPSQKPVTPRSNGSSPSAQHRQASKPASQPSAANPYATNSQLASLAQYQLMYQQYLYQAQAELELFRAQQQKSLALSANKPDIPALKQLCSICALTPGYSGHCIHDELSTNPTLMAMLNQSLLYSKLADPASLSAFNQSYLLNKAQQEKEKSLSPPLAHKEKRRLSPYPSPQQRMAEERPMNLHVASPPKSKPQPPAPQHKECHWTDDSGYCGKRFTSQEELMEHIKVHVLSGPNSSMAKRLMPSPPLPKNGFSGLSRFQPYNLTERSILPLRH